VAANLLVHVAHQLVQLADLARGAVDDITLLLQCGDFRGDAVGECLDVVSWRLVCAASPRPAPVP